MLCEICKKEIPDKTKYCIHCGSPQYQIVNPQSELDQIKRIYSDIQNKRRSSKYLHLPPQLLKPVFTN